jgi:hypothetical protein
MKTGQGSLTLLTLNSTGSDLSDHLVGALQHVGGNPSKENPKSEYRNPKQTHAKAEFEFPSTV